MDPALSLPERPKHRESPTRCRFRIRSPSLWVHYPGAFPRAEFDRIRLATGATLSALGLQDGVFHAEFVLSGEDVVPIDIAARGGGVMIYTHVVRTSRGSQR